MPRNFSPLLVPVVAGLLASAAPLVGGCVTPAAPPANTAAVPASTSADMTPPTTPPAAVPPAPVAAPVPTAAPAKPGEVTGPPLPPWKHGENPFVGAHYWTDPYSPAVLKAKLLRESDPEQSKLLKKIADNGGADWIGDWTPNVGNWVNKRVTAILKTGSLPLFIAYNLPKRDCGNYSAGGSDKAESYKKWISAFAKGIGDRRAAVMHRARRSRAAHEVPLARGSEGTARAIPVCRP